MAVRAEVDPNYFNQLFHYDAETGSLTWATPRRGIVVGDRVGTLHRDGYYMAKIDTKQHKLANIIWAMRKGVHPSCDIHHKDSDRANNRWENLEEWEMGNARQYKQRTAHRRTGPRATQ